MSKKGAKAQPKAQSYEIRDVVLAKVRGYPPWPGIIVDPDSVPKNVAKERPNAKSKKGNWYCIRFFPAGDYAWIVPKDISKLQEHEIQAYIDEPYKKSGDLLQGYKIALDPKKWEEDREAAQAEEAEAEANAEVDQLESDAEEEAEDEEDKKPKTKKRKRESEVAPTKTKAKTKVKKEPAEPKKKAPPASKGKKNGIKSKAMIESEDEGAAEAEEEEDAGPSKKASPPPAKKQKRDKEEDEADPALAADPEANKVRDWRHKLQKAFLSKSLPKDEDMPALDTLFTTVESYDGMSIQYLTFSKIGKVMRHIHALAPEKVSRDEEFKFRDRAKALVDKWHDILNASKANGDGTIRKPATNGKAHSEDAGANAKSTNGKDTSPVHGSQKTEGESMEVDAKNEEVPAAEAAAEVTEGSPEVVDGDAPADAEAESPAAADESMLADVTMSEAA
ncbi:hypothetical protein PHLCEN_2v144 [Hermanssonia centrifuga]|uniref:PWWP domain-containing protein n=1 Tax=Hermanssonia centrifuga TaxID=98765 RepID=A0A2R6S6T3_9APHY|nr:hypothetical protein PHLCEN_2v144 [Hermanssonia centrifuga]